MGKAEITRSAIIEATLDLSLEHGFAGTTLQMIGSRVGISHGAVHKHFPDKEFLLKACAETAALAIRAYVDARIDPMASSEDQLKDHILHNMEWVPKLKREMAIIVALYYQSSFSDPIRELFAETYRVSISRVAALVAQGNREKCWHAPDPLRTGRTIHNLIVGESFKIFISPREMSLKARFAQLWSAVRLILRPNQGVA